MALLWIDFLLFVSVAWLVLYLFSVKLPARFPKELFSDLSPFLNSPRFSPYLSYLQRKITAARWKTDPKGVAALQILCGLGFMAAGWLSTGVFFYGLFLSVAGFFFPLVRLNSAVKYRQKNMIRDLSFYLDLVTLGVESGLDYASVLFKILENAENTPLKEELEIMIKQIQMGQSRAEAWREFSIRIDLPEMQSLILAFIQTDQVGSPLAGILRNLSEELRTQRFQLAEKRAHQMPVKMLVPLLGCIFPAVFIILFEPLILRLFRIL